MVTEIREFGDNKTIVVFTNERQVATRIQNWNECYKVIEYEQEQFSKGRVGLVGLDLYLPKRLERRVRKLCGTGKTDRA